MCSCRMPVASSLAECLSWLDERYHNNHRILPSSRPPQHVARVPSLGNHCFAAVVSVLDDIVGRNICGRNHFLYVMLTNYALLHDATHDTLRSGVRANYWLGFLAGIWFPVPFSMIHYTHRTHHRFNRTDAEMFDLYYPTDNLFLKYTQWFSILCGLFWPLVPLGAVVIACTPSQTRTNWFAGASPARGLELSQSHAGCRCPPHAT